MTAAAKYAAAENIHVFANHISMNLIGEESSLVLWLVVLISVCYHKSCSKKIYASNKVFKISIPKHSHFLVVQVLASVSVFLIGFYVI